jgi:hypothetical protein
MEIFPKMKKFHGLRWSEVQLGSARESIVAEGEFFCVLWQTDCCIERIKGLSRCDIRWIYMNESGWHPVN